MKCRVLALLASVALSAGPAAAQSVTTGALGGRVLDAQQQPIAGASVVAIHVPSGTTYEATTRADGRFTIPGMRVGGPYSVTVASAGGATGFEPQTQDDVTVNLGIATDLDFVVRSIAVEVTVTAEKSDAVFSSDRTGAATAISRESLATLPTITGRLENITRLTPQQGGNMSFAGQDNRMNNITVDGAAFNNSFGLRTTPGETSGVAPISLDAIEQVQVSLAPFDVRQGNFVGAGVNTVTRSGTNEFRGSFRHQLRDNDLVGTKAKSDTDNVNPGTFNYRNTGGYAGGPIVRNTAFFFGNYEDESLETPGTTFRANNGGEPVTGNVTRVLKSDLDRLSAYLRSNFNYETGPYQDYPFFVPAKRFLGRGDYNLNDRNKIMFRYQHLDSSSDSLVSTSSSLGLGRPRGTNSLNFQRSNYSILENIRTTSGEWNTVIGNTMANSVLVTFSKHDESRGDVGELFPFVDVLNAPGGTVYTSFGSEPFTPNNELRYQSFIVKNDFTKYTAKHALTLGGSFEAYESENVFFPGKQSAYVFNSLDDFYADADGFLANPTRTVSPITLRRFQVRWSNIPGQEKPIQPLEVGYTSLYAQDNWRVKSNLTVNGGVRVDVASFGNTGYANANADALTFRDESGAGVQYSTAKLPDATPLWSPRVGFNWDLKGDRMTQVRGGTGVFTGKPAFVWISNQIGNTGVLTGFASIDNTNTRPFNPNPDAYKPATVTGDPASAYELALTDADFRFPQTWRTNIAVDRRLPWGWSGTAEFMYNRDLNGLYYINANLPAAQSAFVGADTRPRYTGNRIHSHVSNAIVLKNQDIGRSWNFAGSVERALRNGLWVKGAYSYGESKNTIDPGSIAFGSWNNNQHPGDPNNPPLAYSNYSPGHRVFVAASYTKEYFSFGRTTVSMFWEAFTAGNSSYTYATDLNGDGGTSNDLVYIPRNTDEMNFTAFTSGGRAYTAAEQAAAWEAYIQQDRYLREHRGEYAERGGVFLPIVKRMDLSVQQDLFTSLAGRRHAFQFRVDMLNFLNMLNHDWGVGQRMVHNQPLTNAAADSQGRATYRLRIPDASTGALMSRTFEPTAGLADVWRVQFSFRYSFN